VYGGKDKLKRYVVYMANGDVLHLIRRWSDFWLWDTAGFMSFRNPDTDKLVRVNRHFTIKVEHE
jgi:hypothetical protein